MTTKKEGLYRTGYMSEIDSFLREFDKKRQFSPSRIEEKAKNDKIAKKRDGIVQEKVDVIWPKE